MIVEHFKLTEMPQKLNCLTKTQLFMYAFKKKEDLGIQKTQKILPVRNWANMQNELMRGWRLWEELMGGFRNKHQRKDHG